jgi:hypothetical protein
LLEDALDVGHDGSFELGEGDPNGDENFDAIRVTPCGGEESHACAMAFLSLAFSAASV